MTDPPHQVQQVPRVSVGETSVVDSSGFKTVEPHLVRATVVDGIAAAHVINGAMQLAFYAERPPLSDEMPGLRVIVERMTMSPVTAAIIAKSINKLLEKMVETGVLAEIPRVDE